LGDYLSSVLDIVDREIEWGINVLKKFIEIPTVNPPGKNYKEFVEAASKVLKEIGMSVEIHEVPKDVVSKYYPDYVEYPRYILLARLGTGSPVIQFNGHYDVVPEGSGWSKDPFKPVVENGRLYGRGSVDMKGGIVAAIVAVKAFKEAYKEFNGAIEIALVPDEEIGGETGTGYLVREGLSKPNYVIIGEPSGSEIVWIGHRGALWFFVEVYGKQAHGSTPWLGVNAFEYMVKVAEKFMKDYKDIIERKSSKYTYDDPRGAKPTITIGGEVRGGAKTNIVPGYYAFSVDRRLIVEESPDEVEKEVKNLINEIKKELPPEVKVELKVTGKLPPAMTSPESPLVRALLRSAEKVLGSKPRTTVCLGGLDMRYYTEVGIDTVTYGPGPMHVAHQADEYISIDEFTKIAKIYALLLENILIYH